ncbi:Glycine/D-amino acid oxidase (deaminating) [Mariprofundus aestuarium]|uniref:Glycine/D-amino acid oxidase (Deaminating) n=1 Tax=Mariprofundus aestuarium TaxID=1921086 RepID=A0A2K8KYR5_MARES|nr:FAD-binding oxidoreductase [Mariprofundus aestuarium]ATX80125.1 Glycine/D-amino acid oxidase (deaminating) [Mariprofundus aestuarium]
MPVNYSTIDTLIIGQGLAGSILAWQLMKSGQKTMVISDDAPPSASRVAAGLFNPVTGKRLVLQTHAETIIPAAKELYRELEAHFDQRFFHEKSMLRVIKDAKEHKSFEKRSKDPAYAQYLGEICDPPASLISSNEVFEQHSTGYLDTNRLLDCLRDYFIAQESYRSALCNYNDLTITDKTISWSGIKTQRIIFCEGFMGKNNPWFNWLPFQPAKGEILSLRTDHSLPDQIINGGKWLLPVHDGSYKTGATYDHDLSSITPSEAGKAELIDGMQKLFSSAIEFELLDHKAGVRPNTLDKQPFIGLHPRQPEIGIFNGFGSKGSMLIPYYSKAFAMHLIDGSPIPVEADICRIQHG